MNNVVKEEAMRKETDQVHIHELIEERVVEDQKNEMIKAIACVGDYRLADEYKQRAITPLQWTQMTSDQRKEYVEKLLRLKSQNVGHLEQETQARSHLSVSLSACDLTELPLTLLLKIFGHKRI